MLANENTMFEEDNQIILQIIDKSLKQFEDNLDQIFDDNLKFQIQQMPKINKLQEQLQLISSIKGLKRNQQNFQTSSNLQQEIQLYNDVIKCSVQKLKSNLVIREEQWKEKSSRKISEEYTKFSEMINQNIVNKIQQKFQKNNELECEQFLCLNIQLDKRENKLDNEIHICAACDFEQNSQHKNNFNLCDICAQPYENNQIF